MYESELIEQAKLGNKSALNILITNNYKILKGYVIKLTGDKDLSDDIVQETLLRTVINIKKFKYKAKFSTFLITIANNIYIDIQRKEKRRKSLAKKFDNSTTYEDSNLTTSLLYKEALKTISSLPYEKKSVFILKHFYGYKYDEISEILGIPIGTVRSRLHNVVKELSHTLKERGVGNE